MPNIPTTNVAGRNFNYHLQTNVPGLNNRLNVNVTHQLTSKLSLQVNYNLSNATSHSLSSFQGIEGNTFTRGQSVMIGLTQNFTKTFIHTSQLFFSRNRSLGEAVARGEVRSARPSDLACSSHPEPDMSARSVATWSASTYSA